MTPDPVPTLITALSEWKWVLVGIAFFAVLVVLNVSERRRRARLTEEQRKAEDEQDWENDQW